MFFESLPDAHVWYYRSNKLGIVKIYGMFLKCLITRISLFSIQNIYRYHANKIAHASNLCRKCIPCINSKFWVKSDKADSYPWRQFRIKITLTCINWTENEFFKILLRKQKNKLEFLNLNRRWKIPQIWWEIRFLNPLENFEQVPYYILLYHYINI